MNSHQYDDFLEAQCVVAEAKGQKPQTMLLMAALREQGVMGLKEGKDIVDDFLRRRSSCMKELP